MSRESIQSRKTMPSAEGDRARKILKARARELGRPIKLAGSDGQSLRVIQFRMAHEKYAVEQRFVREIQRLEDLAPLPCTPPFLRGLINVRGQILPVIDLKKFFDLPDGGITDLHLVLILHVSDMEVGLLADAPVFVNEVPSDSIQASLPTLTGIRSQYLRGVTGDRVVILDVERMLSDSKLIVNEEVDS